MVRSRRRPHRHRLAVCQSAETGRSAPEAAYPSVRVVLFQASVMDGVRMTGIPRGLGPANGLVLGAAVIHRREKATDITKQELRDAFDTKPVYGP
ncbi:uncharacterized protein ACLA_061210 [Aspergillus clavatus NRRL 1]|uniref:Uncharacterized protein n=1 Tax=Aspergillus clavatus (strain ATCC 1007 / CBS 513.65 / DSM 816 / NCTC 3887 / NRRL 1 / QM 1276 / 107) TaxID=344612 RepID=A1CCA3_ASPCL|nr:uncharacterized protein ACLA_061210 [Aspergillus clavatus NRRL 1]EAW12160.1 hypothetical protein ACLA_061210 [Aspergillus clavatus NRRL 1]